MGEVIPRFDLGSISRTDWTKLNFQVQIFEAQEEQASTKR